jgi:glycosyltransferase involved in cell wall biosynthesis
MTYSGCSCLLTIAVPTYNRASYLDLCLAQICSRLKAHETEVELLVSNNCSTDATDQVVRRYLALGYPITYLINEDNIGPDRNFEQCYRKAKGKYALILGDDDVLLEGALDKLLAILSDGDYGIVFLNSYGFTNDFIREKPVKQPSGHSVYTDTLAFSTKVAHYFTFTSANIFNRTLVDEPSDWGPFFHSNLVQLAWTFSALFNGKKHVYISEYLLAARLYDWGGYALTQVFGHNFNKICKIFRKRGVDDKYFRVINRKLLVMHFPALIALERKKIIRLKPENYFRSLYPLYHGYLYFWLFTVPAIVLPAGLVYRAFRIAQRLLRQRPLGPSQAPPHTSAAQPS